MNNQLTADKANMGYIQNGKCTPTGTTTRGAKIAATKAGALKVGFKAEHNGLIYATSTKACGKWS